MDFASVNLVTVALVVVGAIMATCSLGMVVVLFADTRPERLLPILVAIVLPSLLLAMGIAWGVGVMPFLVWVIVLAGAALVGSLYLVVSKIRKCLDD